MKRPQTQKKATAQPGAKNFVSRHPSLALVIVFVVLIGTLLGVLKYVNYTKKFSDKDFAAIEMTAKNMFTEIGAQNNESYKYCHYVAPEKYSNTGLYCGIEMAAYMEYKNDQQAISIAKLLERDEERGLYYISFFRVL